MQRREFITLLGGAAAAWSLPVRAQQSGPMRRVSVLMSLPDGDPAAQPEITGLTSGLRELRWVEGRNIHVDYRWLGGDVERARVLAKEAIALKPDVLVARSTPAALALKAETKTVPIVFVSIAEPLLSGLVEGLARPGGNVTGFTCYGLRCALKPCAFGAPLLFEGSIGGKLLELLKEVSPTLKRAAIMYNPNTAPFAQAYLRSAEAGAAALAVELRSSPVQSDAEIEAVLAAVARGPGGGLVGIPDTFLQERRDLILALLARHRLPAIFGTRIWGRTAALMVYSVDTADLMRRAASYFPAQNCGQRT